ncbi:hypothetical protein [Alloyangia pacifica]|uniref:hypothetical protein n=1 Tax=Alloyangia pacifica TaxID=311180 RepID=UPI00116133EC|nr:hypothetical protein [Alloyangia pacifica]
MLALTSIFAVLGLGVAAAIALLMPQALPRVENALLQGAAFSAFLTSLDLIRGHVRASKILARATARIFAVPAQLQAAAMTYGAQMLAVLFIIGTIGMLPDIANSQAAGANPSGRAPLDADALTLTALRGTIMMTVWNPIGVGFAIVTSAMSIISARHLGVSPSRLSFAVNRGFTVYGLLAAASLTSLTYAFE